MARPTRSAPGEDGPAPSAAAADATATKKRKHRSLSADDEHASKHSRDDPMSSPPPPHAPLTADVPMPSEYAARILDVLQAADTQGLLDRVCTPPPHPAAAAASASHSLRALLLDSPHHPLSAFKIAVESLLPLPSHSRAPLSPAASQQIRFCKLALSLFEEASFHSVQFPLDRTSVLPDEPDDIPDDSHLASPSSSPLQAPRKYALVQHLPQGDYWSSLSSSLPAADAPELATGFAELVAVFPQPYPSTTKVPTLGAYHRTPVVLPSVSEKLKLPKPKQRVRTAGSFLDYGPWSSFAPTFELEHSDIGRVELGQVYYDRDLKKRAAAKRQRLLLAAAKRMEKEDHPMDSVEESAVGRPSSLELDGLLAPEDVENLKSFLDDVEMLRSVEELLTRNLKALLRLEELQSRRLEKEGADAGVIEQDSEEWEIAQSILDSLTLLASLRPRTSNDKSTIMPSAAALHTLQRTLPLQETPGWHGTLPATSSATAIRDDATIKVRPGATVAPAQTTAPAPVTASPAPLNSFTSFNYITQGQAQYRAPGTPVANTAQATYNSNAYRPLAGTTTNASYYQPQYQQQTGQNSYYAPQTYATQQPYSTWYQQQQQQYNGGTTSGRGTPQPAGTQFTQYFPPQASATPSRPPAVANTVVGAKQQAQWAQPATPLTPWPATAMRAGQSSFQATR